MSKIDITQQVMDLYQVEEIETIELEPVIYEHSITYADIRAHHAHRIDLFFNTPFKMTDTLKR